MKLKQISLTNANALLRLATVFFFLLALSACKDHDIDLPGQDAIQPTGPRPEWSPTIKPQMLAVIEELGRLNPVPLTAFSAQEARTKPTFKDAVNSLLDKNGIAPPVFDGTKTEKMIPGANGAMIPAYIYKPAGVSDNAPVIVYYHGGGWVLANTNVYEYSVVALARNTGAIVVSVDYRRAPEFKFPTAHEDAYAGYKWVKENAASIGGNPDKVAVAGESAGGNKYGRDSLDDSPRPGFGFTDSYFVGIPGGQQRPQYFVLHYLCQCQAPEQGISEVARG